MHNDWILPFSALGHKPVTEDLSATNAASIVFLFEQNGTSILFTGDSTPEVLEKGILLLPEGKKIDFIKLPHHGSSRNTTLRWLKHVRCRNFILSADGRRLPDKQAVAVLLEYAQGEPIRIYTNYMWWEQGFLTEQDRRDYVDTGLIQFVNVGAREWRIA